jgi:hypothetical protein
MYRRVETGRVRVADGLKKVENLLSVLQIAAGKFPDYERAPRDVTDYVSVPGLLSVAVQGLIRFLLLQKLRVRACALEDHGVGVDLVDEQPIACEVAFPSALVIADQFVIT